MSQKDLINREIRSAEKRRIRGTVLTEPRILNFDLSGSRFPTFVVDVDIGRNRILEDVPVKINGPKARFYARPGSPVYLDRDAFGRYQVIAPADRAMRQGNLILINEDTDLTATGAVIGFTFAREPYEFYQGVQPESFFDPALDGATLVWLRAYDRALGLPVNISPLTDADGANVLAMVDKSGNGHSPAQTTAGLFPLYRRFDATGGNSNTLSTVDFDGANDELNFPAAINEGTPGQLSIFLLLQKDAAGSGNDIALELDDWRIYSRRSGGDTWGFDQGGGVQDSGSTIGTSFVLIELIATSFNDVNLYENGTLLGTFTPGGGGLGTAVSVLGGSATLASHGGRIAELLIMDETVTATKRQNIEAYFNQAMFVAFARYRNTVDGYPKIRIFDADGNEVTL